MKRMTAVVAALVFCVAAPAFALYSVSERGEWPKSWPKLLEPLRKQSRTLVGPMVENRHYAIPFTKREEMEAAWPSLLKVKSKGAPIILVKSPNFFLGEKAKAGVVVHCPPADQADKPAASEAPIPGQTNPRAAWMNATYIEVVVDGQVIDWSRLPVPADTPVIDERARNEKNK